MLGNIHKYVICNIYRKINCRPKKIVALFIVEKKKQPK